MELDYDAFLSYNSNDADEAQLLVDGLRQRQIRVFFDDDGIRPGSPSLRSLETAIVASQAMVVCIGGQGLGRYQKEEVELALNLSVSKKIQVIPVFLPSAPPPEEVDLPLTLQGNSRIVIKVGIDDPEDLDRIVWGVTGVRPERRKQELEPEPEDSELEEFEAPPELPPDEPKATIEERIDDLVELLEDDNLTFFIGMDATPPEEDCLPTSYEVSEELMKKLGLLEKRDSPLLLPIDLAGDYYASGKSETSLERVIRKLLANQKHRIASPHAQVVEILRRLQSWRHRIRESVPNPQLVVTTNVDLMMERALLRRGLGFTRIVQHSNPRTVTVTEFRPEVDDKEIRLLPSGGSVAKSSLEGLDRLIARAPEFEPGDAWDPDYRALKRQELIEAHGSDAAWNEFRRLWEDRTPVSSWPLRHFHGLVLFKFLGSRDIRKSCVIGRSQLFELADGLDHLLFRQIKKIVQSTPNLFIGHGYLDPYFRLICDTMLKGSKAENRFLVQQPPRTTEQQRDRRVEWLLWRRLGETMPGRTRVRRVQYDPIDFLKQLETGVRAL